MTENMRNALAGVGGTSTSRFILSQSCIKHPIATITLIPQESHQLTHPAGGLQTTSSAMGDVLGNSYDMRGGQSKKSDEAGKAISSMGKGEFRSSFPNLSLTIAITMCAFSLPRLFRTRRAGTLGQLR
jgi:hypothetical protein